MASFSSRRRSAIVAAAALLLLLCCCIHEATNVSPTSPPPRGNAVLPIEECLTVCGMEVVLSLAKCGAAGRLTVDGACLVQSAVEDLECLGACLGVPLHDMVAEHRCNGTSTRQY